MGKESFIIYKSFWKPVSRLNNEQLGRLFRALCMYQVGEAPEVADDIQIAYDFFINQFEIDEAKYNEIVEAKREGGRRGGSKRTGNEPDEDDSASIAKDTQGMLSIAKDTQGMPSIAKDTQGMPSYYDNVNVNENVFFKEKEINKEKEKLTEEEETLVIAAEMMVAGAKDPIAEAKRFRDYNKGKTFDQMISFASAWKAQEKRDISADALKWLSHVVYRARDANLEALKNIITGVGNITAANSYWLIWCTEKAMRAIEAYACERPKKKVKYSIITENERK